MVTAAGTVTAMVNRLIGGLGKLFIAAGVILLLFTAFQLWGTGLGEASQQKELTQELAAGLGVDVDSTGGSTDDVADEITSQLETIEPTTAAAVPPPPEGDAAGFIEIPRIGLQNKAFVEGVSKKDLRRGPGHYPGTPLPGQAGNAAIAGHRTTYGAPFNRIDELVPGDVINVYTPQGKFVYEVLAPEEGRGREAGPGWFAVRPSEVSVIAPTEDNRLTLTACHPKYSARLRIIVQAALLGEAAPTAVPTGDSGPGGELADENVVDAAESGDDLIAGDAGELRPTLAYGGGLLALWTAAVAVVALLRPRTSLAWVVYLVVLPVGGLLLWNAFLHLDRYLPSF